MDNKTCGNDLKWIGDISNLGTIRSFDNGAGSIIGKAHASAKQIGGEHYKNMTIQPAEFCQKNRLNFCESAVIKYVCRHTDKGGAEDIRKAIHFLQLLLEIEYPEAL